MRKRDKFWKCLVQSTVSCQGFPQHIDIDYEEMYCLVVDSIPFRYLLHIEVDKKLETRLMNVYGSLNIDMYMKVPVRLVEFQHSQIHQYFELEKAMYGLKHASKERYKRLRGF